MKTCHVYFFVSVLSTALTAFGGNDVPSVILDLPPSGTNCRNSEGAAVAGDAATDTPRARPTRTDRQAREPV